MSIFNKLQSSGELVSSIIWAGLELVLSLAMGMGHRV